MNENIKFLRILTKKPQWKFDIKKVKRIQIVLYTTTITAFYAQVQYNIQRSSFNFYNHNEVLVMTSRFEAADIWSRSISLTCSTTGISITVKYKAPLVPWITTAINMF